MKKKPSEKQKAVEAIRQYPSLRDEAELSPEQTLQLEAVRSALLWQSKKTDTKLRETMVRLIYWHEPRYSLREVAQRIDRSYDTVKRWHGAFVEAVSVGLQKKSDFFGGVPQIP